MAKIRRNISVEEETWNELQKREIDCSSFCSNMLDFLLESLNEQNNTLAELQNELIDVKTKIHLEHLKIAQSYEENREVAEENARLWQEFLEVAEDYYYDINVNQEFLNEIIRITGIHESKLYTFANWINEYQGRDEDQVRSSFNYAFNKYNETTKGSRIFRDSKEIIP